jgi:hypothetical protein
MDFQLFEDQLYIHGLAAMRKIRRLRPNDTFYSFAFFTSGDFVYMAMTASSYEGLSEAVSRYKEMEHFQQYDIEEIRRLLKWSPADSPLHTECGGIIEPLQSIMNQVRDELYEVPFDEDDWTEFELYVAQLEEAIANALRRIDAEGLFGSGDERKRVVVNLLMGERRIEFARRVNPPESVKMLIEDLDV